MRTSTVRTQWRNRFLHRKFRTAVSLHGHTLHSRESLDFAHRLAAKHKCLASLIQERFRGLDIARIWWTPPLSPHQAWNLERRAIERLGFRPLVSLSDHDNIEAPLSLQVLQECRGFPISVEWTVPLGETFLHLGVHNLSLACAQSVMNAMASWTRRPAADELADILQWLTADPQVLVVLNHPLWDEAGVGADRHLSTVRAFLTRYGTFIHALEWNGLRTWRENLAVSELAESAGFPVISGGDRHGTEPSVLLNLTNASSFSEFAGEIRRDRKSDLFVLRPYRVAAACRIVKDVCDIVRVHEDHSLGWKRWSDRVFYEFEDGTVRSLTQIWNGKAPFLLKQCVRIASALGHPRIQGALRLAFPERAIA